MATIDSIIKLFEDEFSSIKEKFTIIKLLSDGTDEKRVLDYKEIHEVELDYVHNPGVYVFYGNGSPYRVGRHLTNTRLRVMQHIKENTGDKKFNIKQLDNFDDREVILFNLIQSKNKHWAAALEIFLEESLKDELKIPAKRQG